MQACPVTISRLVSELDSTKNQLAASHAKTGEFASAFAYFSTGEKY